MIARTPVATPVKFTIYTFGEMPFLAGSPSKWQRLASYSSQPDALLVANRLLAAGFAAESVYISESDEPPTELPKPAHSLELELER